MIKKHEIAVYLDASATATPDWFRIAKATELKIAMNPETEEYDYIADENPTTELDRYAPEISGMPLKMYKGNDDFDFFYDKFYNMAIGSEANVNALIVYKFDYTEAGTEPVVTTYKAWQAGATISVDEMNANDSELSVNIALNNITKGTVVFSDGNPTFTEAAL
jgi:hypothetical protein